MPKKGPKSRKKAKITYEDIVSRTAGFFKYIEGKRLDIDSSALTEPELVIKEVTAFLDNNYQSRETQRMVAKMIPHVKHSVSIKTNKDAQLMNAILPFYDLMERDGVNSP
jgi:hypothetical protein